MSEMRFIDALALGGGGLVLIGLSALLRFCPPNRFGNALRTYYSRTSLTSLATTSVLFLLVGLVLVGMSIFFLAIR